MTTFLYAEEATSPVHLEGSDTNLTREESIISSSISVENNGTTYNCDTEDLIAEDINGTNVYHCATQKEKELNNNAEARGTAEIERLAQEVVDKNDKKEVVLVESKENNGSKKYEAFYADNKSDEKFLPIKLYLSLRYMSLYHDHSLSLKDNSTRTGVFFYQTFPNDFELAFQYEAAVTIAENDKITGTDAQIDPGFFSRHFTTRLSYVALKKDEYILAVGRYWGVYYDIAAMTDQFLVFGSQGTGAFNAGSDGAGSGTGRAVNVVQFRIDKKHHYIGLQVQNHLKVLDFAYSGIYAYAAGASYLYKGFTGLTFGVTGNYAVFKKDKITGHTETITNYTKATADIALLAGVTYRRNKMSLGYTLGASKNHVIDDQGTAIDIRGSELYLRYRFFKGWRTAVGFNYLTPIGSSYKGDYEVMDFIASIQYSFNKTYTKLVYVEGKNAQGHFYDGSKMSSAVAVGFRYLLDY